MVLLSTMLSICSILLYTISFVTCSLQSVYWEYWIFRTYNFTWNAHWSHISTFPLSWLKYLSYGIGDLYIVSAFLRCHHFRDDQKNLLSVQSFTAKVCTRHYVQWQEWYIYSEVSLKTKQRYTNNLAHDLLQIPFTPQRKEISSRFQAMIHWMLHFWDTSDALESPKSSLVFFQSVRFFTTLCNEDLQNT